MATQEAARKAEAVAGGQPPAPVGEPSPPTADADVEPEPATDQPAAIALALGPGAIGPQLGKALDSIGTYIPTEVIATYLAVLAIVPAASGGRYLWLMFWGFLAATPIVVWLGVAAAHSGAGLSMSVRKVSTWPWLAMFAASLAFLVFAVGVPGSVINREPWYEPWMTTAAIILSAFVLSQINRAAQAIANRA